MEYYIDGKDMDTHFDLFQFYIGAIRKDEKHEEWDKDIALVYARTKLLADVVGLSPKLWPEERDSFDFINVSSQCSPPCITV